MKFDELYQNCLTEMAATYKDVGSVKQTISDIKSQNLPHHYQKPLVAIADDTDRDEMIDKKKAADTEHKDYEAYWNKREEEGSTGF